MSFLPRIQAPFAIYPSHTGMEFLRKTRMVIMSPLRRNVTITCTEGLVGSCTSSAAECAAVFGAFGTPGWATNYQRFAQATIRVIGLREPPGITIIAQPPLAPGIVNTSEFNSSIYADCPRGVLIPGTDRYVIRIFANAGRFTLAQWGIVMTYDTGVLSDVIFTIPDESVFTPPSVSLDTSAGTIGANTNAVATSNIELRRGANIHIATISFAIDTNTAPGLTANVITGLYTTFLINVGGGSITNNQPAHVYDASGRNSIGTASIQISMPSVAIGMYAAPTAPFIIVSPSGTSTSVSFAGLVFWSICGSVNRNLNLHTSTCSSPDESNSSSNNCQGWSGRWGIPRIAQAITVSNVPFSALVQVRTYAHTSLRLTIDRPSVPMLPGETR